MADRLFFCEDHLLEDHINKHPRCVYCRGMEIEDEMTRLSSVSDAKDERIADLERRLTESERVMVTEAKRWMSQGLSSVACMNRTEEDSRPPCGECKPCYLLKAYRALSTAPEPKEPEPPKPIKCYLDGCGCLDEKPLPQPEKPKCRACGMANRQPDYCRNCLDGYDGSGAKPSPKGTRKP